MLVRLLFRLSFGSPLPFQTFTVTVVVAFTPQCASVFTLLITVIFIVMSTVNHAGKLNSKHDIVMYFLIHQSSS